MLNVSIWLGQSVGLGEWARSLVEFVETVRASGQRNGIAPPSFDLG